MAILFTAAESALQDIGTMVKRYLSDLDIRIWPDVGNPDDITYIISTRTAPTEHYRNLPNLKAIFITAAGIDAIVNAPDLPDVPIVRGVNDDLSTGMAEYVAYHTLMFYRDFHTYAKQQQEQVWKHQKFALQKPTVGIMGLGAMGLACADTLKNLRFPLRGWSRTDKAIDGITTFAGIGQLPEFLSGCTIVACVLPLTDETRNILNKENLSHMPRRSYLISAGRGEHMVETDILELLDSGHLAGAALDVFATEPLPENNPLWTHPRVIVTPHIASITNYKSVCADIRQQIEAFENGQPLQNVVDIKRGY